MAVNESGTSPVRQAIRFFLDDELVELRGVDPNRTVLQWLREDRGLTGTKEGCAEGDCGACAVVIANLTPDGNGLCWRAINSCIQFVPTLDGKQLLTVESLCASDGRLHPVQQAMVECHGSQCGFCTPGFVMSLFALYQAGAKPSRAAIDDALAGNLCRCTGYRPIIAAAHRMHRLDKGPAVRFFETEAAIAKNLRALKREPPLDYQSHGRRYAAPHTIDELAEILERAPEATILAGGTDVGLWVTKEYRHLEQLVYTGDVAALQSVGGNGTQIEIGAAVTLTDAMPPLIAEYPELEELFARFAGPPIRNAATLGGNIANGSPIGDSMPALIALGSQLVLRNGPRQRTVPLDAFYLGYRKTALEPGEFVIALTVPRRTPGLQFRTYKISKRYDQDISAVCAAFCIWLDNGTVSRARISFGGVAATPARASGCEAALRGADWNAESIETAAQSLAQDFSPITDMRATAGYRRRLCRNLLWKFFHETSGGETPMSLYRYGR